MTPPETGRSRLLTGLAFGLAAIFVLAVVVISLVVRDDDSDEPDDGPLGLSAVPAPQAESAACRDLLAAVPGTLSDDDTRLDRRELRTPAPVGAAAWGDPPIVLRCGLQRPAELTRSARLLDASGVDLLEIGDATVTSWIVVDRPVYVAITLPKGTGSGPLQELGEIVRGVLPEAPVDLGP